MLRNDYVINTTKYLKGDLIQINGQCGISQSDITVITGGLIALQIPKKRFKIGDRLYYNPNTHRFAKIRKKGSFLVGWVLSTPDQDGFATIKANM